MDCLKSDMGESFTPPPQKNQSIHIFFDFRLLGTVQPIESLLMKSFQMPIYRMDLDFKQDETNLFNHNTDTNFFYCFSRELSAIERSSGEPFAFGQFRKK